MKTLRIRIVTTANMSWTGRARCRPAGRGVDRLRGQLAAPPRDWSRRLVLVQSRRRSFVSTKGAVLAYGASSIRVLTCEPGGTSSRAAPREQHDHEVDDLIATPPHPLGGAPRTGRGDRVKRPGTATSGMRSRYSRYSASAEAITIQRPYVVRVSGAARRSSGSSPGQPSKIGLARRLTARMLRSAGQE